MLRVYRLQEWLEEVSLGCKAPFFSYSFGTPFWWYLCFEDKVIYDGCKDSKNFLKRSLKCVIVCPDGPGVLVSWASLIALSTSVWEISSSRMPQCFGLICQKFYLDQRCLHCYGDLCNDSGWLFVFDRIEGCRVRLTILGFVLILYTSCLAFSLTSASKHNFRWRLLYSAWCCWCLFSRIFFCWCFYEGSKVSWS